MYRCDRMKRAGRPQYSRGRSLNSDIFWPKPGSKPTRTREVRRGAVHSRTPSPARRACPPAVVCSKAAHTDIDDEFGTGGKRLFVWSCCPDRICVPVLADRCDRLRRAAGPQYSLRTEPLLGYLLARAGRRTGKDKRGEAWRVATIANLASGLGSMPSSSCVFESCPYPNR